MYLLLMFTSNMISISLHLYIYAYVMYVCIHFNRSDQIKTKIVNLISSDQKFVSYLGETNLKLRTISLSLKVQVHKPSTQEGHEFQPSCTI